MNQHGRFVPPGMMDIRPHGYPGRITPRMAPPPNDLITSSGVSGVDDEMDLDVEEVGVVSASSPPEQQVHTSTFEQESISNLTEYVATSSDDPLLEESLSSDEAIHVDGVVYQSMLEHDNMSMDGDQLSSGITGQSNVQLMTGEVPESNNVALATSSNAGW